MPRLLAATAVVASLAALVPFAPVRADDTDGAIGYFADLYAGGAVNTGQAIGAGVAVLRPGHTTQFYTYGYANLATGTPFDIDTRFEIGSVTKVFTTTLLGLDADDGAVSLGKTLSQFPFKLGPVPPNAMSVTLEDLASFTAGYPDVPACSNYTYPMPVPIDCVPSGRPSIAAYGASAFTGFFNNYQVAGLPPQPWLYSNFSVGLLGLLLAATPGEPMTDAAVGRWMATISADVLAPLGMHETSLVVPPWVTDVAVGYQLPVVRPLLETGTTGLADPELRSSAGPYTTAPRAIVTGGGGTGATLTTTLNGQYLSAVTVVSPGSGYVLPATIGFAVPPGSPAPVQVAYATAVISNGAVTGVIMTNNGSGYAGQFVPVTFSGGRSATVPGHDATGLAVLVGGHIAYVLITDGGAGYVPPLTVTVDPPAGITNQVPIWAAAGALTSSLRDMARFAAAAMSPSSPPWLAVPPALTNAFALAETPRRCNTADPTFMSPCPGNADATGLAWDITPGFAGAPAVTNKNGGLNGFSTDVLLLRDRGISVVAFVNSRQPRLNADGTVVEGSQAGFTAETLAAEMLAASQLVYP